MPLSEFQEALQPIHARSFSRLDGRNLGVKVVCTETKCVATGDPHCEFETVQTGS